jgi:Werner syndrome ATP-dependent helicase
MYRHNTFGCSFNAESKINKGEDVIAILPTGYGKSLCFQIPPLMSKKLAIVISPLIALMKDQKLGLDNLGIDSCCYNSSLSESDKYELEEQLLNGKFSLMYITPESLSKCYNILQEINDEIGISLIAIDEAHCLSSYGFDFRPKYREIYKVRKYLPSVPVLAITATATDKVRDDIIDILNMKNYTKIKASFDRPNLKINVLMLKRNYIQQIKSCITGPTIIYCLTKKDTEDLSKQIPNSKPYHAGLSTKIRTKNQEDFMKGEFNIIIATIAFGMGINKTDIRTVIHYGCPQNLESYYQEIGRAGRDGNDSNCFLFYNSKDFVIQRRFINNIKNNEYRRVRGNLLRKISNYVNTKKCRRKIILKYFNEEYKNDSCDNCDNCLYQQQEINPEIKDDLFIIVSQIHEIQRDFSFSYGAPTIYLILKGSKSKKIKSSMKKLNFYGSLKSKKEGDLKNLISKAVELRLLEVKEVREGIRVINCTKSGLNFISV